MGDPVTMAMIGAAVGGTYGAATGKDPLKSAMMGAAVGGGGALMGAGGLGAAGAKGAGAAGSTGLKLGASSSGLAAPSSFSGVGLAPATSGLSAGNAALSASPNVLAPSLGQTASPSLLSSFTSGLKSINTFANQNPVTTNIGLQTAGSLLATPEPAPMAPPPGLMRGQQFQIEEPMYAMAQRQPISLI